MPELPEVETVKEALRLHVRGKTIEQVNVHHDKMIKVVTPDEFKEFLKGQTILDITRRGKHLIFHFPDFYMISHLRMEGKYFFHEKEPERGKHTHVTFQLASGESLHYDDVRKFGTFHLYPKNTDLEATSQFKVLGLEPFDPKFTFKYFTEKIQHKKKPIKSLLLDQSVVTGLGNIYVDEVLFRSRVHPLKMSANLTHKQRTDVVNYTKEVLSRAIELKGTTIKTFASEHGVAGTFQNELKVHTKKGEPCPMCGTVIEKIKVGGRGTYLCPRCQKLPKTEVPL
ncbi:MAG: DNA-formamidopyrimidine glycosylase [Turicibacter sp.]|nr:DNA-formamidopyrimidine glycosylase [Turicibacter sp.]